MIGLCSPDRSMGLYTPPFSLVPKDAPTRFLVDRLVIDQKTSSQRRLLRDASLRVVNWPQDAGLLTFSDTLRPLIVPLVGLVVWSSIFLPVLLLLLLLQ